MVQVLVIKLQPFLQIHVLLIVFVDVVVDVFQNNVALCRTLNVNLCHRPQKREQKLPETFLPQITAISGFLPLRLFEIREDFFDQNDFVFYVEIFVAQQVQHIHNHLQLDFLVQSLLQNPEQIIFDFNLADNVFQLFHDDSQFLLVVVDHQVHQLLHDLPLAISELPHDLTQTPHGAAHHLL